MVEKGKWLNFQSSLLPNLKQRYAKTTVDLRINETRQTGAIRKTKLPFYHLVGAVSNCAYSVRLKTAPTGVRKCLFIFRIHHKIGLNFTQRPTYRPH